MSDRDPFADFNTEPEDLERTIIVPAPGGKRRQSAEAPPPPPPRQAAPPPPGRGVPELSGGGSNPLLRAANAAFGLVRQLRDTPHHQDPDGLRNSVIGLIQSFESQARDNGASAEAAYAARYALSALIDETVLSTPWGSQSSWAHESILVTLHNEARGGAKFFQILERMRENPGANIDLLEFLYLCLSLGFQGKYAVMDGGHGELDAITQNLYRTIRHQRGEIERDLSPRWQGLTDKRPTVARFVPLWVVPVAGLAAAILLFLGFSFAINWDSDQVVAEVSTLGNEGNQLVQTRKESLPIRIERVAVADQPAPIRPAERLQEALRPEIDQGFVEVRDLGNATKIIVHNKGLFASGQDRVSAKYRPVLQRIAAVLDAEPKPLRVTGHTDSDKIRTLKFPSNWHLSVARAKSVAIALAGTIAKSDLVIEGRADEVGYRPPQGTTLSAGEQKVADRRIEIRVPVK